MITLSQIIQPIFQDPAIADQGVTIFWVTIHVITSFFGFGVI